MIKIAVVGALTEAAEKLIVSTGLEIVSLASPFTGKELFTHVYKTPNKTAFRDYSNIPPKKMVCSRRRKGRKFRGS